MKVLIVEDEDYMKEMYVALVRLAASSKNVSAEIHAFNSLSLSDKEFERTVRYIQDEQKYDVAILDVVLPVGNGFRIANTLREQDPDFPILLISGVGDEFNINQAEKRGLFLQKPLNRESLENKLNMLIDTYLLKQDSSPAIQQAKK